MSHTVNPVIGKCTPIYRTAQGGVCVKTDSPDLTPRAVVWYTGIYMVRMRMTKGKRNSRRSHHGAAVAGYTQESGVYRMRHRAGRVTGLYRGRTVLDTAKRAEKKRGKEERNDGEKRTVERAEAPLGR